MRTQLITQLLMLLFWCFVFTTADSEFIQAGALFFALIAVITLTRDGVVNELKPESDTKSEDVE